MNRYSYEGDARAIGTWPWERMAPSPGYLIFDGRVGHDRDQAIARTEDRFVAETIVAALNAAERRA